VLPALPAFSILLAAGLDRRWPSRSVREWRTPAWLTAITPLLGLIITVVALTQPQRLKTAKPLVHYFEQHAPSGSQLVYVQNRPFSARFYSRETAGIISPKHLPGLLAVAGTPVFLAVPKDMLDDTEAHLERPLKMHFQNRRYVLVTPAQQSAATARRAANPAATSAGINDG